MTRFQIAIILSILTDITWKPGPPHTAISRAGLSQHICGGSIEEQRRTSWALWGLAANAVIVRLYGAMTLTTEASLIVQ